LNAYVKIDTIDNEKVDFDFIKTYSIVLATDLSFERQVKISKMCREHKIKFVSADCHSAYCRLVNDFG